MVKIRNMAISDSVLPIACLLSQEKIDILNRISGRNYHHERLGRGHIAKAIESTEQIDKIMRQPAKFSGSIRIGERAL